MKRACLWRVSVWAVALACSGTQLFAQDESRLAADFRRQKERFVEKCGEFALKAVVGCGAAMVTDHPLHLALGSIAPGNGFGFGLAFVPPQWNPNDDWRIRWSADAVAAPSGAWRAGVYAKVVRTRVEAPVPTGPGGGTSASDALPRPYPTISVFSQVTSLPAVSYFGLGSQSSRADRALFAMRQSTVGTRVFWPIGRSGWLNRLNPTVIGELSGRWVRIAESTDTGAPSIGGLFSEATAPGLATQPATVQFGEGVRIAPSFGRLQLTYTGTLQQVIAPADSRSSFRRWTVDLGHDFALWTTSTDRGVREYNGPNECTTSVDRRVGEYGCPDPTVVTTNRVGSIGLRALVSRSGVSGDSRVPFYFQRTIGGSDIDGERLLASYDDYRFRGPHVMVLQQTFEHVIWGPIGAFAIAEQGRVALDGESFGEGALRKTFGAGLTVRAGGVPMMSLWWADGGAEGHHIAVTMTTSLLGGGSRPSLR
jgi:hypothetical protein